jgi:hypothetical protein
VPCGQGRRSALPVRAESAGQRHRGCLSSRVIAHDVIGDVAAMG